VEEVPAPVVEEAPVPVIADKRGLNARVKLAHKLTSTRNVKFL
jgi:hypothetical protein